MKKILSLVLVIALVLGSFSFAFAAPVPEDVTDAKQVEAVNVLMALGIVNGYPDGTFKPERTITRAEMAKILVEALGYGDLAAGTAPYSDTAGHWAEGYIAIASGINIVQGYPDGTFLPNKMISFNEAITMVLRALGYTDESLRGTWPTNYMIKALDLQLFANTSTRTGDADRGNIAVVLFNALFKEYGTVGSDNVWQSSGKNLIEKMGVQKTEITVTYADVVGDDKLDSAVDLMDYLYKTVEAYTNTAETKVYAVTRVISDKTVGEVTSVTAGSITVKVSSTVSRTFTGLGNAKLFYNGTEASATTYLDLNGLKNVTVIHAKDSLVAAGLWAWESEVNIVTEDYKADAKVVKVEGGEVSLPTVKVDNKEVVDLDSITVVGDVTSLADIKKHDVVYVYAADDAGDYATPELIKIEVVRETLEGKITEVNETAKKVVIGGVEVAYVSGLFDQNNLGDTVTVALNKAGSAYKVIDTTVAAPANFAVVRDKETQGQLFGDPQYFVRLLTKDGLVVYEAKDQALYNSVTANQKVTYTLNSDGKLETVTTVSAVTANDFKPATNVVANQYLINDDTIIFDVVAWKVLTAADLGEDGMEATAKLGTSPYIDVLYVTAKGQAGTGTDKTYAVIKSFTFVLDGSTNVQRVTHYLDAAFPVVTYTNSNTVVATGDLDKLVDVTINSAGRITNVDVVNPTTMGAVTVKSGNLIKVGANDNFLQVSNNVVVYLLDEDFKVTGVGSMADVVKDVNVAVWAPSNDLTKAITYIFVYDGNLPQ